MQRLLPIAAIALLVAACADPVAAPRPQVTPSGDVAADAAAPLTQDDGVPVMTELANPRGLAWGPDGSLYVVETGRGGAGPCFTVLGSKVCYGPTGAVSRLREGTQEQVVKGLPSWVQVANPNGSVNRSGRAQGASGISILGNGGMYVTVGLEADPRLRDAAPEFAGFATLVHVAPTALAPGRGRSAEARDAWDVVADFGSYEITANPDCGVIDSDPFGVLALGEEVLVADAGANAIVSRSASGELSTVVALPSKASAIADGCPARTPSDFVPTSIVRGPDGALYVGHLGGLPIVPGSSTVWRMERGGPLEPYCAGFTWVIAMAFGPDGSLYVLQHSDGSSTPPSTNDPGSVIKVGADCARTTLVGGLHRPTGLAVGSDGEIYVSVINGQNFASEGQVRRFTP
jgi:hypothetical protein